MKRHLTSAECPGGKPSPRSLDHDTPTEPPPPSSAADKKPILGATISVKVVGATGSKSAVARTDTGAARTCIDTPLASEVGAGPITDTTRVTSASSPSATVRPLVPLVIGIYGNPHVVVAGVEDRGHMTYPVLLGRDVLEYYHVDINRRLDDAHVGGGEI